MKIVLASINSKYIHSSLSVWYLYSASKEANTNHTVEVYESTINNQIEDIVADIYNLAPDVVGFSCYIWNIEYVKKITEILKKIKPELKIFYGGPEASFDADNLLNITPVDMIIKGEGETSFIKLLENDFNTTEKLIFNPVSKYYNPYSKEYFDALKGRIVYLETSRGCPFSCAFCLSGRDENVRFFDNDESKENIIKLANCGTQTVKFVDRTFNCNFKFSMAIWEFLINAETNTQFHFEISADILKPQELELLRKAPKDRFQFEVGVQTTNDDVLNRINRFVNFSDIKEKVVELLEIKNIKQHLDLIAGLPGEDITSFKKSFNDVYSIGPEEIQLGFLKLLRGSSMREEAEEYGMKYSPYPPYEILQTKDVSYDELLVLKKVESMVDKYYNSQKFNNIIKFLINSFDTPYDFYLELGNYFDKKGYFDRNIGNSEYYKVFLDFNMDITKLDSEVLRDIIKYDYLMFNKRRGMPEFLGKGLEKCQESKIKDLLRDEYSFREHYIESFIININDFVKDNYVNKEKVYFLCSYDGDMEDITSKVQGI